MTIVKEILTAYLRANGYDGLCYDANGDECGCGVNDLCPCCNPLPCVPAYRVEPPDWAKAAGCVDWYTAVKPGEGEG